MCDSSHSHANYCSHCGAHTAHRVGSTTCTHGGPDIHTCSHHTAPGCNGACTRLDSISVELERLKLEVSRLKGMQPGGNYSDNSTTTLRPHSTAGDAPASCCGTGNVISWGNGAGAGSRLIYEEMCRTNWHGRLGHAHMADVDRLSPEKLKDLDDFLHQNIDKYFPFGSKVKDISMISIDTLWAGFKEIGLKLDDRTYFAGVKDTDDNTTRPVIQRMRSRVAWCNQHSTSWNGYWNGHASETLLECARYRGLFRSDGTLP